jgi:protein O-GlcNAc transferase
MNIVAQIAECKRILQFCPDDVNILDKLGDLLIVAGKAELAATVFFAAWKCAEGKVLPYSKLLHALLECPKIGSDMLAEAHLTFGDLFDRPASEHSNDTRIDRRLKVGYISDSFRAHAIPLFFEPALRHHDRERYEVYCFSNSRVFDVVSRRLKRLADRWFDVSSLGDDDVVGLIKRLNIDILVELGGHIGDNRLGVLAHQAAPIQISTWHYPCTTGLKNIQYYLSDRTICPAGMERFFSEAVLHLNPIAMCYQPSRNSPSVSKLPASISGILTFGAFHRMSKITPDSLAMWAGVLRRTPRSRLVLHHIFEGSRRVSKIFRADIELGFNRLGVASRRLSFVGAASQRDTLTLYRDVDIALDSYPYSGCTTTAESLWMGVPVITWAGPRVSSRYSASMLRAVHLDQFVAQSPEECAAIAAGCASNVSVLYNLRRRLRQMMLASPLTDCVTHTREIERVYRDVWARWASSRISSHLKS